MKILIAALALLASICIATESANAAGVDQINRVYCPQYPIRTCSMNGTISARKGIEKCRPENCNRAPR